jgi:hypothetical protein
VFVREILPELAPKADPKIIEERLQVVVEVIAGIAQENIVLETWDVGHLRQTIIATLIPLCNCHLDEFAGKVKRGTKKRIYRRPRRVFDQLVRLGRPATFRIAVV